MINVKTFFKTGNDFFDAQHWDGAVDDVNYIYGCICLDVDGFVIFDEKLWDCIDQLWSYIVDGLYCLSRGEPFSFYFPDQAVCVSFNLTEKGDLVELAIDLNGGRRVFVSKNLFIRCIGEEARIFFNVMKEKVPEYENAWDECLQKLRKIDCSGLDGGVGNSVC